MKRFSDRRIISHPITLPPGGGEERQSVQECSQELIPPLLQTFMAPDRLQMLRTDLHRLLPMIRRQNPNFSLSSSPSALLSTAEEGAQSHLPGQLLPELPHDFLLQSLPSIPPPAMDHRGDMSRPQHRDPSSAAAAAAEEKKEVEVHHPSMDGSFSRHRHGWIDDDDDDDGRRERDRDGLFSSPTSDVAFSHLQQLRQERKEEEEKTSHPVSASSLPSLSSSPASAAAAVHRMVSQSFRSSQQMETENDENRFRRLDGKDATAARLNRLILDFWHRFKGASPMECLVALQYLEEEGSLDDSSALGKGIFFFPWRRLNE